MPMKKKKYNARFPPARIKKIMQMDEEVGKVAAPVPVIISRALELFIEALIKKSTETAQSRKLKTLTSSHIKQVINGEECYGFLQELIKNVPDAPATCDDDLDNNSTASGGSIAMATSRPSSAGPVVTQKSRSSSETPRPRGRPRKADSGATPAAGGEIKKRRGRRKKCEIEAEKARKEQEEQEKMRRRETEKPGITTTNENSDDEDGDDRMEDEDDDGKEDSVNNNVNPDVSTGYHTSCTDTDVDDPDDVSSRSASVHSYPSASDQVHVHPSASDSVHAYPAKCDSERDPVHEYRASSDPVQATSSSVYSYQPATDLVQEYRRTTEGHVYRSMSDAGYAAPHFAHTSDRQSSFQTSRQMSLPTPATTTTAPSLRDDVPLNLVVHGNVGRDLETSSRSSTTTAAAAGLSCGNDILSGGGLLQNNATPLGQRQPTTTTGGPTIFATHRMPPVLSLLTSSSSSHHARPVHHSPHVRHPPSSPQVDAAPFTVRSLLSSPAPRHRSIAPPTSPASRPPECHVGTLSEVYRAPQGQFLAQDASKTSTQLSNKQ